MLGKDAKCKVQDAKSLKQKLPRRRPKQKTAQVSGGDMSRACDDRVVAYCAGALAGAAADRRVVEADVAAAAGLAASREALAARLNHRAARLVTRRAANAAAVFGVLALADAH